MNNEIKPGQIYAHKERNAPEFLAEIQQQDEIGRNIAVAFALSPIIIEMANHRFVVAGPENVTPMVYDRTIFEEKFELLLDVQSEPERTKKF